MAKMAKLKQTDYSRGGHDISQTAIPLYQNALSRADDYLSDPSVYVNKYLNEFYSDNAQSRRDFDRQYLNAMSKATANNYAATHGGYSSAGQRSYQDLQRNQNDLYARMREQGIQNAGQMAQNWFNSNLNAMPQYNAAYGLGKTYADIDQYSNIRHQNNSFGNQFLDVGGKLSSSAGQVLSSIPNPWTQGIGAALQTQGLIMSSQAIDPNSALAAAGIGGSSGGSAGQGASQWSNMANSIGGGLAATAKQGGDNWVTSLFNLGGKKG